MVSEEEEKQQGQENGELKLLIAKEVRRQGESTAASVTESESQRE